MLTSLKRSLACTATLCAPNPAADPHQPVPPPLRLPDIHRQVWGSPPWDHCSFLLGPGAQGSVVPSESLFPESISQSHVSSGSSMVGLMVTSSKRAYAILKSAAPRASVPVTDNR